jgi:bilirubin oxidase
MGHIDMAPGERNEILIDLSDGQNAILMADLLPADPEDVSFWDGDNPQELVVELRVNSTMQASGTLPDTLNDIAYLQREDATQIRTISLDMEVRGGSEENMDLFGINGQAMDMSQINFKVNKGEVEIWRITGQRMPHPFHIHGVSFQILRINGEPVSEADRGWKDTVVVWGEVTEIAVRFDFEATEEFPLMVHCHMLEHEEFGMMWQFTVN